MKRNIFFIIILLISGLFDCSIASCQDTIYFHNSQFLIGELLSIKLGKIEFDPDDVSEIHVKSEKIRTISARAHLFKIEIVTGKLYYSFIYPSDNNHVILLDENNEQKKIRISNILLAFPLSGKFQSFWQLDASIGYSFTRSSNIGRFNSDINVKYTRRKFELIGRSSSITTHGDRKFNFENATINLYGSYLLATKLNAYVLGSYQHNEELGLASRFQEGLAMGYSLITQSSAAGILISGLLVSQEKSLEGIASSSQLEIPIIFLFDLFKSSKPDITIKISQGGIIGITQGGRFRQDGQIKINFKVFNDLSLSIQMYNNYDNKPPVATASNFDYGVVFGIQYEFSQ